MRALKDVWNDDGGFGFEERLEELAYRMVELISRHTHEAPEIYNVEIGNEGSGEYAFSITNNLTQSSDATLDELKLFICPDNMSVEIAELRINKRGTGLGKMITMNVIKDLQKLGYMNFTLDAQNMGPDFWPQFGFTPKADKDLQMKYAERFEMLKPYLPPLAAAMISFELKQFNSFSPLAFSRMKSETAVKNLCQNEAFLKAFAVKGSPEDVAALGPKREVVSYIIEAMIDNSKFKLGTLLNARVTADMELNLRDEERRDIFNAAFRRPLKNLNILSLCKN